MSRKTLLLGLFLAGCAGGAGADDSSTDAGGNGDGGVCQVHVVYDPLAPVAGETVYAQAQADVGGFVTWSWTVTDPSSADVPFDVVSTSGDRIRFVASTAGPYHVSAAVDSGCESYFDALNVRVPGATDTLWRLRLIAPAQDGVPPQERTVDVPSGTDYDTGSLQLDLGTTITGHVRDALGNGVPAYLRLVATSAPDLIVDGFAGADGSFQIATTLDRKDVLVVPFRSDLPSFTLASWTPQSGDLTADAGVTVSGRVADPAGADLVGATVTISEDGVPSSVATTDASGHYVLHAHDGTIGIVDVVAPAGSGLPRLTSAPTVLVLAQPVDVAYAGALVRRDVGGVVVEQGGTIAANAQVTFTGAIASAGTVNGTAQASGSFAIRASADGSGVLPATQVPAVPGTAIVMPSGSPGGVIAVDLTTAAPATIDAPLAVSATGVATDALAAPIPGAAVRATPSGALAAAEQAEVHVTAAADGSFALPLAGGGHYDLTLVDPRGDAALLRTTVLAGPLGTLALPDGLGLVGTLVANGSNVPGVAVTIYCEACSGDARRRPAAEAATSGDGTFRVTLLDPGVQ